MVSTTLAGKPLSVFKDEFDDPSLSALGSPEAPVSYSIWARIHLVAGDRPAGQDTKNQEAGKHISSGLPEVFITFVCQMDKMMDLTMRQAPKPSKRRRRSTRTTPPRPVRETLVGSDVAEIRFRLATRSPRNREAVNTDALAKEQPANGSFTTGRRARRTRRHLAALDAAAGALQADLATAEGAIARLAREPPPAPLRAGCHAAHTPPRAGSVALHQDEVGRYAAAARAARAASTPDPPAWLPGATWRCGSGHELGDTRAAHGTGAIARDTGDAASKPWRRASRGPAAALLSPPLWRRRRSAVPPSRAPGLRDDRRTATAVPVARRRSSHHPLQGGLHACRWGPGPASAYSVAAARRATAAPPPTPRSPSSARPPTFPQALASSASLRRRTTRLPTSAPPDGRHRRAPGGGSSRPLAAIARPTSTWPKGFARRSAVSARPFAAAGALGRIAEARANGAGKLTRPTSSPPQPGHRPRQRLCRSAPLTEATPDRRIRETLDPHRRWTPDRASARRRKAELPSGTTRAPARRWKGKGPAQKARDYLDFAIHRGLAVTQARGAPQLDADCRPRRDLEAADDLFSRSCRSTGQPTRRKRWQVIECPPAKTLDEIVRLRSRVETNRRGCGRLPDSTCLEPPPPWPLRWWHHAAPVTALRWPEQSLKDGSGCAVSRDHRGGILWSSRRKEPVLRSGNQPKTTTRSQQVVAKRTETGGRGSFASASAMSDGGRQNRTLDASSQRHSGATDRDTPHNELGPRTTSKRADRSAQALPDTQAARLADGQIGVMDSKVTGALPRSSTAANAVTV